MIEAESKGKRRAYAQFWIDFHISIELGHELFGDCKAQPDSLRVHLARVLYEPKQFEQLLLILLADTYAGVFDWDLDRHRAIFFLN